jgi:hypothetical protein
MGQVKHELSDMPIYNVWSKILSRCHRPRDKCYKDYGGRGIRVCDRWMDVHLFLQDMGMPAPGMTIDRIDNDGDYEPGNCRWATQAEQNDNKRTTRMLEYQGRVQTLRAWAEEFDINPRSLSERLRRGWDLHRALTWPGVLNYETGREKYKAEAKRLWALNSRRYRGLEPTVKAEKAKATIVKEKVPVTELLELKAAGKGIREIARITGVPKSTVSWQLSRLG